MDKKKVLTDRFVRYCRVKTPSNRTSETVPSSMCQFDLARILVDELKELGLEDAHVDDKCYVYATIPATEGYEAKPAIGFIAHMDTVSDYTGGPVVPMIWPDYDGNDLILPGGRVISVTDFPHLPSLKGRTLITSDGNTILGSDDKSGIAEIMTLAEMILESDLPHGKICIGFTPDEEIGRGPDHFDVKGFGADYAYTLDGGAEGSLEYENFNAATAEFTIYGKGVHPGYAKGVLINAALVAMQINAMLPAAEIPSETSGYEGFYHLIQMEGDVEKATLQYIIRDHDLDHYHRRLKLLSDIEETMKLTYGEGVVVLKIREEYRNMRQMIEPHFHLV
ncbi:MAG: peptidase T, partial [Eubacterium sp.]|nr:peptidase T [Eubacterium sp.]